MKVSVSKLDQTITKQAKQITLVALNAPKTLQLTSELNLRLKKLHLNRFVTEGNKLSCIFYGKILEFTVKKIQETEPNIPILDKNYQATPENGQTASGSSVRNLETEFSKLSTSSVTSSKSSPKTKIPIFHRILNTTVFKLFSSEKDLQPMRQINPLAEIGGYETEIEEICDLIDVAFGRVPTIPTMKNTRGLLLYGAAGTGKSLIANGIAQISRCATVVNINGPDLFAKYAGAIEETIVQKFNDAVNHPPSIILLDELDILCPVRSSKITEQEKRTTATLLVQLDRINSIDELDCKVFVIATTNKIDNIDPAFRTHTRLDREIEIAIPSPATRFKILKKILSTSGGLLVEDEIRQISHACHGFTGSDLNSLVSRAGLAAIKRNLAGSDTSLTQNVAILANDVKYAMTKVQPSAMRAIQIEVPNVKWSDIGGQDKLKLILKQAVEWPLKHADSFHRLGITPPRGVLMYGPPGCSKTMIAKALATESGLNFLSIKGPELFNKYVGESERAIREVFRRARQVAPSIVFFDEIDALGGERTSGAVNSGTSVQERVLAQLLTELDGITPLKDVTILAATNRPDRIDRALIRPGRLDRIVYVPLPDAETRKEIFRIKLAKMPTENVDVGRLVDETENYSGAEINAVCHEAAMCSLEENIQAAVVTRDHFEKALKIVTPRTSTSLLEIYTNYVQQEQYK